VRALGVIPTRMGASRFPGKPLVDLEGRPLVQWVYDGARTCLALDALVVATPDDAIAEAVRGFGGAVVMTAGHHLTGTDRVAEVAATAMGKEFDVVVNIQGDQPFVTNEMIDALVAAFADSSVVMSTLGAPLADAAIDDPNSVKVICDVHGDALYFSRSAIPYRRNPGDVPVLHHLGLYAFRREFLAAYAALAPTPLEHAEGLEQLRALEHGYRIRVGLTDRPVIEVNTPDDLVAAAEHVRTR
jgi:3-deoxy-manno-octulosonate cytidylyltransferase (CMP-KDO synthetase)